MATAPIKILVVFPVPIPVGHRVRAQWFRLEKRKPLEKPYEPTIQDLDTGILYTSDWLFASASSQRVGEPLEMSAEPQAGIVPAGVVSGRVAACRIITLRRPGYDVQTELTIVPEAEGYRG